jgi:hypothetical protein
MEILPKTVISLFYHSIIEFDKKNYIYSIQLLYQSYCHILLNELNPMEEITTDEISNSLLEYSEILKLVGYRGSNVNNLKKYKGKNIIVNGKLNLSYKPVYDLGKITVNGGVDLSRTNIKSIDGITANGTIWTWDTSYQRKKDYEAYLKKLAEQDYLREIGKWDSDSKLDDQGKCANALFQYLSSTSYEVKEEGDKERLDQTIVGLKRKLLSAKGLRDTAIDVADCNTPIFNCGVTNESGVNKGTIKSLGVGDNTQDSSSFPSRKYRSKQFVDKPTNNNAIRIDSSKVMEI